MLVIIYTVRSGVLGFALTLALAASAYATPSDSEALRAELLEMQRVDQAARKAREPDAMRKADESHTARLKGIVEKHGWPTYSMVREDGARAAWLIAQHADADPLFQKKVLSLMEPLVARNEASGQLFAYLFDRTHRPQRFGTQGACAAPGVWKPREIEDPEGVDARRAAVAMQPARLADYAQQVGKAMCNAASVRDLSDTILSTRSGRLSPADITLLGVTIGKDTLDQVQARFGKAETFREKPGSASAPLELCYSMPGARPTWVIFGSGPMGGWKSITHFQVHTSAPKGLFCTPSTLGSAPVETASGVRVGMTLEALQARFGNPTERSAHFVTYAFLQKSDHPQRREFDMTSFLSATLTNGMITSLHVSLVESN